MSKYIFISCLCIFLIGCASKETTCEFYEGFAFYMKNEHRIEIAKKPATIYYLMPLSGCEPCVASNLEMLASIPKSDSLLIIFVGISEMQQYNDEAATLKKQHNYVEDIDRNIYSYETDFGKPLLIHIDKKNCYYYEEITDLEVEDAKIYLEKHHE
ncbi:hypothetical protein [Kordia sp.]|uniref:hypothetical protein n=1 Tax=Kordia sp. TaxID=1965332 RepID=UPI003D299EC2